MTPAASSSFRIDAADATRALMAVVVLAGVAVAGGYALAVGELQALYVGLALVACVAIMIDYRAGAMLLLLLLPISSTAVFPSSLMGITGLNPMNLLLVGTLAAYLVRGRLEHAGRFMPSQVLWLLVVPIALAGLLGTTHFDDILSVFFDMEVVAYTSWRGYLGVTVVKPLLLVLAALLVAAALSKAKKPENFVVALAAGAVALALLVIGFVVISDVRLSVLASSRSRGFFSGEIGAHANDFGRIFVTAYALMLFTWWESKQPRTRLALFAVICTLIVGIILTFSRNAFLGFFIVNGLFLLWKFNMKKVGWALLGLAVSALFAPGAIYRRMSRGFDSGSMDDVSAGRIEGLWMPLLPETLKSPVWGQGLDSILWADPLAIGAASMAGHPHNAYLQAVLDMGLLGLALLLAFYWHVWKGFRALGSNPYLSSEMRGFFQGACAALIAFAAAGMTGGSLRPQPDNVLLWLTIGIMYGLLARKPASSS
jgi:O-antigen ligase